MSSGAPAPATVLDVFDTLGPPGTPLTTPEVAEQFDCTDRTIYNKLDALVSDGILETKKVGARGRVWWRPPTTDPCDERSTGGEPRHAVLESRIDHMCERDIGVYALDTDFQFAYLNEQAEAWLDTTDTQLRGEFVWDAFEYDDVADDAYHEALESGEATGYVHYYEPLGQWLENHVYPTDSGLTVYFTNVTARKEVERELREHTQETEQRYRTLFESMNEGFCLIEMVFDEDGEAVDFRFLETNPAFEELTGLTDAEGKLMRDIEPDHEAHWFEIYGEIARTSEAKHFEAEAGPLADRWFDVHAFQYGSEDSQLIAILFNDITERKRVQQRLKEERDMFADGPAVVFRWTPDADAGWPVEYVSANVEGVFGYTPTELESGAVPYTDLLLDEELDRIAREVKEHSDATTERFSHDPYHVRTKDGELRWVKDVTKIVRDGDGAIENYLGYLVDITERKQREEELRESEAKLERLNTASRDLIEAAPNEIHDRAVPLTQRVLGVEYASLWRYDETSGELREAITRTGPETDADPTRAPNGGTDQLWQAFIGDNITISNHPADDDHDGEHLRNRILVPLGRHGVICAGSFQPNAFDEQTVDLAETLGATIEAAWDRAETERELTRQNEELHRLDGLNGLIRQLDQALVDADTHAEIAAAVCERLAASEFYEFAWLGEFDAETGAIEPQEWAGVDSSYLEELTPSADEAVTNDPTAAAMQTRELQIIDDVATDPRATSWRERTLERGGRSCIAIPLVYEESLYGVLTVYGSQPQPDNRETAVLAEFSETIAHAINAAEAKATLRTDTAVKLTLRSTEATMPLARLSGEAGCTIEIDGVTLGSDDEVIIFFTASGSSPEYLDKAAETSLGIEEVTRLAEREEGTLFRARLIEPKFASLFDSPNSIIRSVTIDAGTVTVVVDVPETEDVREFITRMEQLLPDVELRSRTTRSLSLGTHQSLQQRFIETLTPRQREILQTAYQSGYFQSPRAQTGKELSDVLDISQSTFTHHLREAERKLFDLVLDQ